MVVQQQGKGAAAAQLAIDGGRRALGVQALRLKPGLAQQRFDQVGRFGHPHILRGNARLPGKRLEDSLGLGRVFVEITDQFNILAGRPPAKIKDNPCQMQQNNWA